MTVFATRLCMMAAVMRSAVRPAVLAVAVLATPATEALGQEETPMRVQDRILVNGALIGGLPTGEFSESVDFGYGLSGGLVVNLDEQRMLGFRLDASVLTYGRTTRDILVSDPLLGLLDLEVVTENNVATVGAGLQFTAPSKVVRPYLVATAGFAYFWTETSLAGTVDTTDVNSTTNLSDFVFSATVGGGLLIKVNQGPSPVFLTLSAYYQWNGTVTYMSEDSISETFNGTPTITVFESEANLVVLAVGVSVGVG
jgi:hypothetical protein